MKKVCLAFTIIFGILFSAILAMCLIAFIWHPYDFGETLLMSYEDLTGDLGHTVDGFWIRLSWVTLWTSVGLFVVFGLCLVGAILFKAEPVEELPEKEEKPKPQPKHKKVVDQLADEAKEEVEKHKKKLALPHLFRKKAKKIQAEVEAKVEEEVVEPVKEEVKEVKKQTNVSVNDFLSQFKKNKH